MQSLYASGKKTKNNLAVLFNARYFLFVLMVTACSWVSAQGNFLLISGSSNVPSVNAGNQFIYTFNYSVNSFTKDAQNTIATIVLPQNLVPYDINNFANSISYDKTQVANATYTAATNTVTITFVNPLPAGSTGQLQIKFKYLNGNTPNNYAPDLFASINASNNINADGTTGPVNSDTLNVISLAKNNFTITKTKKFGGAIDNLTIYTITVSSANGNNGSLTLRSPVVVDTLLPGVTYQNATAFSGSNPPVYDAVNNTVTWTWPVNADSLVYNYNSTADLSVIFTSPTYAIGSNACNKAYVEGNISVLPIGTDSAVSNNGSTCFTVEAPAAGISCNGGGISAATASVLQHAILSGTSCNWFSNGWYNSGNTQVQSVNLTYTVDKSIDMTTIRINPVYDGFNNPSDAAITVQYTTNLNNSFVTLGTYSSLDLANHVVPTTYTPSLASGEYIVQVNFNVVGNIPIGGYEDFSYCGNARTAAEGAKDGTPIVEGTKYVKGNPAYTPENPGGDGGTVVTNNSIGSYTYNNITTTYSNCGGKAEILQAQPVFEYSGKTYFNADSSASSGNFSASDTVLYQFGTYMGGNVPATNVVVTDTLNSKLSYVPGSSYFKDGSSSLAITPVVNGNILTYNLGTLANGKDYYITFKAVIAPGTSPVTIYNKMGLTSDNALFNGPTDSVGVSVISAVALRAFKGQSGCDPAIVYYPTFAVAQAAGPVNYKITLKNLGNVAAKNLVLVDVFPFIGDARGSQWFANLVAPVTISDNQTKVFYATVSNPCYSDFSPAPNPPGCNTPDWSTVPPVDITKATAIKITKSSNIAVFDSIIMSWPMRAPVGVPEHLLMNNSITYQVSRADNSSQLLPATPHMVGMYTNCTPVDGSLGNYVWIDSNRNGLQDEPASLGLNGVKVYLYSAGPGVTVGNGTLIDSTVTGNDFSGNPGYYTFVNLASGNYYVKFPTSYAQFLPTPVYNQANEVDFNSDMNPATGYSGMVTINASGTGQDKDNTTIDAGYYPVGSIGNYVWYDANKNGLQDEPAKDGMNGFKIYLLKDNGSGSFVKVDSTTTANDANGNPGYYNFNIIHSGNYEVQFPTGLSYTVQDATPATDGNSDANTATGLSPAFTMNLLGSGVQVNNPTIDAGILCSYPVVSPITGFNQLAILTSVQLSEVTPDGVWASDNTAVATVDNTGKVTGIAVGTANITYSVTNFCGFTTTVKFPITITTKCNNLTAGFTINQLHQCITNNKFIFTNTTTGGNGPFIYNWDFNDGNSSSDANPVHVYSTPSDHDISLNVTDANGCQSGYGVQIAVGPVPVASFNTAFNTYDGTGTTFSSTSSNGSGNMTYYWNLGNGTSSTLINPMVQYTPPGIYDVKLVVTSSNGCADSVTEIINTLKGTASLCGAVGDINGLATVCTGTTSQFTDTSANGTWTSGNPLVATVSNSGLVTGIAAGTTTITYSINTNCGVSANSIVVTVSGAPATPVINGAAAICTSSPDAFTANSAGGFWKSSDETIATVSANGVVNGVAAGSATISYSYNNGCGIATANKSVTIINCTPGVPPVVGPISGPDQVTVGASIQLSDSSTLGTWSSSHTGVATVDNTGKVTGIAAGITTITYTETNSFGTTTSSFNITCVAVPIAPGCNLNAKFSVNTLAQCVTGNSFVITNQTTGGNGTIVYSWDFNDGSGSNLATPPAHVYSAAADHDISLKVTDANGCQSGYVVQITVGSEPTASFKVEYNTGNGTATTFISTSTIASGNMTYFWDLGDGTTSTLVNPTVNYPQGDYKVKLVVTGDGGCKDSIASLIKIDVPGKAATPVTVSPNPANANTNLSFTPATAPAKVIVKVLDAKGKLVSENSVIPTQAGTVTNLSLYVGGLSNGTYYVLILDENYNKIGAAIFIKN